MFTEEELAGEEWVNLENCPGYQISSLGQMRFTKIYKRTTVTKMVKPRTDTSGRKFIRVPFPKESVVALDRLIASAFVRNPEDKTIVFHANGDLGDCSATNLIWMTPDEVIEKTISTFAHDDTDEWRNIRGYEGTHQINRNGDVRVLDRAIVTGKSYRIRKGMTLRRTIDSSGFPYAILIANNKRLARRIDFLVAETFLPGGDDKVCVMHKDGDKSNCNAENLVRMTLEEYAEAQKEDFINSLREEGEEWRDIKGFESMFMISSHGRVLGLPRYTKRGDDVILVSGGILSPGNNGCGYKRIHLSGNGKDETFYVHRLVAEAFIPRIEGCDYVNHRDEVPGHDSVDNLEWVTAQQNVTYGTAIERRIANTDFAANGRKIRKPVLQYDANGNFVKRWSGICEAADALGFHRTAISMACNRRKSYPRGVAYGYRWDFEGVDYDEAS